MRKKSYTIYINGQEAIDITRSITKGNCYAKLSDLGQLEVVLNSEEVINDKVNKWVTLSFIPKSKLKEAYNMLKRLGFGNCYAEIAVEVIDGCNCLSSEILFEDIYRVIECPIHMDTYGTKALCEVIVNDVINEWKGAVDNKAGDDALASCRSFLRSDWGEEICDAVNIDSKYLLSKLESIREESIRKIWKGIKF